MSARLKLATLLALPAIALAPAVAWSSSPRGAGSDVSGPELKQHTKRAEGRRLKKPNPTPLWSLYPLRQGESPEPKPEPDTDALSTPPVKTTERPAEDTRDAADAAQPGAQRDASGSVPLLAPAALLGLLVLAVGLWALARRSSAPPRQTPPAVARARATRRPTRAAPSSTTTSAAANGALGGPGAVAPVSANRLQGSPPETLGGSAAPPASRPTADRDEEPVREQGSRPAVSARTEASASPPPATAPAGSEREPRAPAVPAASEPAPEATPPREPAVDREPVRVHLFDGRVIEGYKRGHYSRENRVLVLDVERVLDAGGREIPSTPLDSFLLPPQIDRIEPLGPAEAGAPSTPSRAGRLPAP